MEITSFGHYAERCFRGTQPPCMCECPLKVDVRAVIDKAQKGNFTTAYRLFRNQAVFPLIVSRICDQPCKPACLRNQVDTSIDLRYIEQACVEFTKDKEPIDYNVPPKNGRIAIIGAGLSGMACALKMASRQYEVTVYEKEAAPGGMLANLLPQEVYLADFENEFNNVSYNLVLSTEITDLSEIQADAIYVATGQAGNTFGVLEGLNRKSLGTNNPGVFLGGSAIGATPIEAIEHGVRVSHSIERYLASGLMDGVPETYRDCVINQNYGTLSLPPSTPVDIIPDNVDKDTAIAEANRCAKCDCSKCWNGCDLMQTFNRYPQRIVVDVEATVRPIEQMTKRVANRLINTCNQCGLCKTVCPEDVDMEDCLLQARRYLFKDGALPAAFHDFWLRDMEFANSPRSYALVRPEEGTKSDYLFFPGCQLGASEPNYVLKAYDFLKGISNAVSLLVGCCGVPADWAGDEALRDQVQSNIVEEWRNLGEPTFIMACPTCEKTFARYLPQIHTVSLYEFMAKHVLPEWKGVGQGNTVVVYDPCASRYDSVMQESVRELLRWAGYQIQELHYNQEEARCCSYGGHIHAVHPKQVKKITNNRTAERDEPYVTYCSNCRDTFAGAGKDCSHILDILFGVGFPSRAAPDLSQRRRHREELRSRLLGRPEEGGSAITKQDTVLDISPELKKKMNEHLILEEDVRAVIEHSEETGNKLENTSTGEFTGYLNQGPITYWVTYVKADSRYIVKKVYSHRMKIEQCCQ